MLHSLAQRWRNKFPFLTGTSRSKLQIGVPQNVPYLRAAMRQYGLFRYFNQSASVQARLWQVVDLRR